MYCLLCLRTQKEQSSLNTAESKYLTATHAPNNSKGGNDEKVREKVGGMGLHGRRLRP